MGAVERASLRLLKAAMAAGDQIVGHLQEWCSIS